MKKSDLDLFSKTERLVIRLIRNDKRTITDIAKAYCALQIETIFEPNAVISSAILRINKKCKFHKLNWRVESSGLGRRGKTVWLNT